MQHREVMVDLRIGRKNSGLLQRDVALLLGTTQPRISRLEQGRSVLSIKEACALLIIYNQTIDEMFPDLSSTVMDELSINVEQFPGAVDRSGKHPERRQIFLHDLSTRLTSKLITSAYEN